jgi:hypothetical protein
MRIIRYYLSKYYGGIKPPQNALGKAVAKLLKERLITLTDREKPPCRFNSENNGRGDS